MQAAEIENAVKGEQHPRRIARMRWLVGILLLATTAAASESIIGRASVVDGDTLEIHGTRIRLWGVDAPESNQLCRDDDAKHFRCGARAANDLDAFIRNRLVTCIEVEQDRRHGRRVGVCTVD